LLIYPSIVKDFRSCDESIISTMSPENARLTRAWFSTALIFKVLNLLVWKSYSKNFEHDSDRIK